MYESVKGNHGRNNGTIVLIFSKLKTRLILLHIRAKKVRCAEPGSRKQAKAFVWLVRWILLKGGVSRF